ncbi:hypothetical protein F5Y17DRAFT_454882 [Xylariaceae sp. FL0594]|nr:hypothetical protein F5Y17DRAFT_454882 [Xylariaceae sp. FL0594]
MCTSDSNNGNATTTAMPLVNMSTVPGKRCPTCLAAGKEVWVFAGRSCHVCATYVS